MTIISNTDLPSIVQGIPHERTGEDPFGKIILRHYGPFVLMAVIFGALLGTWRWVDVWWLFLFIELLVIVMVYRAVYKKEEGRAFRWHVASPLALAVAGNGLFLMVSGGVFRGIIAIILSASIGAHLRGLVKFQETPSALRALFCENVGWFIASFGVFALCATLSGASVFVRFPLLGTLGLVFLGTFLFTRQVLEYSLVSPQSRSYGRWILSLCIMETMAVFLLFPFTPLVLAGLVLPVYVVLLEIVRKPAAFMKRRGQVLGISMLAGAWLVLFITARWP
ncbi:MAG: hypothetical protein AB1352_04245 [Patescibacteria group bacterium]